MPFDQAAFPLPVEPAVDDPVLQGLIDARRFLEHEYNWWPGSKRKAYCETADHLCLAQAAFAACGNSHHKADPVIDAIRAVLPPEYRIYNSVSDIFIFNDARSHAEILDLLDSAIAARRSSL